MKRKILMPAMVLLLIISLAGCVGISKLGTVVFADTEDVTSVLIRDEATGSVTLITDKDSIEKLVSEINELTCLCYPDTAEAGASDKEVRYIISFNPSGDDISLEDSLLFAYSETEFHYGTTRYMAILEKLDISEIVS